MLSKNIGSYLINRLASLRERYEIVGDVRGKGLMIGIELINPTYLPKIRPVSSDVFAKIWYLCRDLGLLIGRGGLYGNVILLINSF